MKNLSILVVDDDPVIRRLLEQRLANASYKVQIAEDGYVAEKLLQNNYYDVILTDLMMPGDIGGIEVLEIAKSISSKMEVLLITAHSSVHTAVEAMKKGASDYLEKPINFDELFLRLDKIANVQTILESARDIRDAMHTASGEAAATIQNLEILATRLQGCLDKIESVLQRNDLTDAEKVDEALLLLEQS